MATLAVVIMVVVALIVILLAFELVGGGDKNNATPLYSAGGIKAPSHYLNQCWRIISEILWHVP